MTIRGAIVCAALAVALPAQATLLVGPGGFPDVQSAITAASNGDIIVVLPGIYGPIHPTKSLTIRAAPGTVLIGGLVHNFLPPVGGAVHLTGIDIGGLTLVHDGTATFDTCRFTSRDVGLSAVRSTVHLLDCTFTALPQGQNTPLALLYAADSYVTATGSIIKGSPPQWPFNTGSPAVRLLRSTLHCSGCVIAAAGGAPTALTADPNSTLWIADSAVTTGLLGCPINATGAAGHQARTTVAPNCGALPRGPLLGAARGAPLSTGAPFTLTFTSDPNDPIGVCADLRLGIQPGLLFAQPLLLAPTYWPAAALVADGSGLATVTWNMPANAALVDRALWLQGFAGASVPLSLSPVTGGVIR